jgi:hypothetical protein
MDEGRKDRQILEMIIETKIMNRLLLINENIYLSSNSIKRKMIVVSCLRSMMLVCCCLGTLF